MNSKEIIDAFTYVASEKGISKNNLSSRQVENLVKDFVLKQNLSDTNSGILKAVNNVSFSLQKGNVIFCFYKHSFETPLYKIIYEKKSNNFNLWTTYHQNNKVRSSSSLEKTIKWIESRYLKPVD